MKKIYLAGPDVFFPDIEQRARSHKQLCRDMGFEPLHPIDQPVLQAQAIYDGNVMLLRQADAVIANLNAFRGAEVDSGTAFEVGYATALGTPVIGYLHDNTTVRDQVAKLFGPLIFNAEQQAWRDRDGNLVEDFGLPVNLMLSVPSIMVVGTFRDALATVQNHL